MLLIKRYCFIALGVILLQACDSSKKGKLESGLEYEFVNKEEGVQPEEGEFVALNIVWKNENDSVLGDSKDYGLPLILKKDTTWGSKGSIEDAVLLMGKGDSAILKLNSMKFYTHTLKSPLPPGIKRESDLTVFVGCSDVLTRQEVDEMIKEKQIEQTVERIRSYKEKTLADNKELMTTQGEEIDAYLSKNNLEAQVTESGIRYIITEEGTGPKPEVGQIVSVGYTGKLLDGTVFDSSDEEVAKKHNVFDERRGPYKPYEYPNGLGNVILGWDEGIGLLNEGSKAKLFIPSPLAYGNRDRSEIIKANSILVFDVELVEIK
ncbi:FKBP-type peptidyl-prolyl cis-trans isomerase [Fulvivirgaceae bacterium BMA10]|uniref:Peptidyl-prolyl cis-trans isomerase n=1 Tax=Splendidivirga corallicola TaxID=3051826 RepID=A0ABT8KLB2_9BACT|nr:FKBP-type peptidyl-prolyl cis-trans isomerase [Fulvivirgaceae bacterium BMA10]